MPGTESIDCLFCATQTECTSFNTNATAATATTKPSSDADSLFPQQPAPPPEPIPLGKWAIYLCKLLHLEDEELKRQINEGYYCPDCKRKIESVAKINPLIEQMQEKLVEFRGKFDDSLYLSNFHHDADTSNGPNQSQTRLKLIEAVEKVKKKENEPKSAEIGVGTDPVIIVEEDLNIANKNASGDYADHQPEPYYFILPENPVIPSGKPYNGVSVLNAHPDDQNCNGVLIENNFSSRTADGSENGYDPNKKHLIKIRIRDDKVVQDIIKALSQQQSSKTGYRQLVVRGCRGVEDSPQKIPPTNQFHPQKEPTPPLVIDLDNENGLVIENGISPDSSSADSSKPPKQKRSKRVKTENPTKNGRYECAMCDEQFDTLAEKRAHWNTHKQGGLFRCIFCPSAYNNEALLLTHVKDAHKDHNSASATPRNVPSKAGAKPKAGGRKPSLKTQQKKSAKGRRDSESLTEEELSSESEPEEDDDEQYVEEEIVSDADWAPDMEVSTSTPKRGRKRKQDLTQNPLMQTLGNAIQNPPIELLASEPEPLKKKLPRKQELQEYRDDEEALPKKRGRTPKTPNAPVVKVSSNKMVTTTTPNGATASIGLEAAMAAGRTSGRLRSKFRQYFY